MGFAELKAALQIAFRQCSVNGEPLSDRQQQILLESLATTLNLDPASGNPLTLLTPEERQALLEFVRQRTAQKQDWKATLLNDWLQQQDSGKVQFLREKYGVQWLQQVEQSHLAVYDEEETLQLSVGDRIEVNNGLWEWVQTAGPCQREWFSCTVVGLQTSPVDGQVTGTVRFDDGTEYEIQAMYDWNRPNWRWPDPAR